jgi:hypothetical protein
LKYVTNNFTTIGLVFAGRSTGRLEGIVGAKKFTKKGLQNLSVPENFLNFAHTETP